MYLSYQKLETCQHITMITYFITHPSYNKYYFFHKTINLKMA